MLRLGSNDRPVRGPAQEGGLDQGVDDALARGRVEPEELAGLGRRQPESRHLVEFGSYTLKQRREIHMRFPVQAVSHAASSTSRAFR